MRFCTLIMTFCTMIFAFNCYSQELESIDLEFDYKLVPSGNFSSKGDSLYTLYITIDAESLRSLNKISVIGFDRERIFTISNEQIDSNSYYIKKDGHYEINVGEWSQQFALRINGENLNDTALILMKRDAKLRHKVINQYPPQSLERVSDRNSMDETKHY